MERRFVGIDVGAETLKVVELRDSDDNGRLPAGFDDFCGGFIQVLTSPRADHERRAVACEPDGCCPADARGRAGDSDNIVHGQELSRGRDECDHEDTKHENPKRSPSWMPLFLR